MNRYKVSYYDNERRQNVVQEVEAESVNDIVIGLQSYLEDGIIESLEIRLIKTKEGNK